GGGAAEPENEPYGRERQDRIPEPQGGEEPVHRTLVVRAGRRPSGRTEREARRVSNERSLQIMGMRAPHGVLRIRLELGPGLQNRVPPHDGDRHARDAVKTGHGQHGFHAEQDGPEQERGAADAFPAGDEPQRERENQPGHEKNRGIRPHEPEGQKRPGESQREGVSPVIPGDAERAPDSRVKQRPDERIAQDGPRGPGRGRRPQRIRCARPGGDAHRDELQRHEPDEHGRERSEHAAERPPEKRALAEDPVSGREHVLEAHFPAPRHVGAPDVRPLAQSPGIEEAPGPEIVTRGVRAHDERASYPRGPFVEDEHREEPHGERREEDRQRGARLRAPSARRDMSEKRTEKYVEEEAPRRGILERDAAERDRRGRDEGRERGGPRPRGQPVQGVTGRRSVAGRHPAPSRKMAARRGATTPTEKRSSTRRRPAAPSAAARARSSYSAESASTHSRGVRAAWPASPLPTTSAFIPTGLATAGMPVAKERSRLKGHLTRAPSGA